MALEELVGGSVYLYLIPVDQIIRLGFGCCHGVAIGIIKDWSNALFRIRERQELSLRRTAACASPN